MSEQGSEYRELTPADLAERWRPRSPLEHIDEVVSTGVDEEYGTSESALRWLLKLEWASLREARQYAANGSWSIRCEDCVKQIVGLTSLVGPISWEEVSVDLVLNGWYERIHAAMGVPTPLTEEDRRRAQEVLDRRYR